MAEDLREVLTGHEPDGTTWSVLAGPDERAEGSLWTFIRRERPGGPSAQSGMGGPRLYGGGLVNVWAGQSDGTPPFVLVRTDPRVERVTVTTGRGRAVALAMSPVVEDFGLRFGAAALPADDEPIAMTVHLADGSTVTGPVPWPRRRGPHG